MDAKLRVQMFRDMLRIRMVEEAIGERYVEQEMRCPVHLSIGQEAVAAPPAPGSREPGHPFADFPQPSRNLRIARFLRAGDGLAVREVPAADAGDLG